MDEPQANTDSQDSPRPRFGGSHHLPPYSILYAWPHGQHSNVILSRDSQVGTPKTPEIGTLVTLEAHNSFCRPLIKMRYKKSYSPRRELFNDMWHVTFTQGN
jgi:hypothetical protein